MGAIKKIADNFGLKKSNIIEDDGLNILLKKTNSTFSMQLPPQEEAHIQKYRQLDADGIEDVDDYVDMKLSKLQRKAEEELKLG